MPIPNIITLFRILIIPLVAYLIVVGNDLGACAIFIIAAVSDFFDGWYARKYKMESSFGALMDPIADKVLLCVVLIFLCVDSKRQLSPILACLLISREFIVTGLRSFLASKGIVMAAAGIGKLKTIFQLVGMGMLLFYQDLLILPIYQMGLILLWISVLISYAGLIMYCVRAYKAKDT